MAATRIGRRGGLLINAAQRQARPHVARLGRSTMAKLAPREPQTALSAHRIDLPAGLVDVSQAGEFEAVVAAANWFALLGPRTENMGHGHRRIHRRFGTIWEMILSNFRISGRAEWQKSYRSRSRHPPGPRTRWRRLEVAAIGWSAGRSLVALIH